MYERKKWDYSEAVMERTDKITTTEVDAEWNLRYAWNEIIEEDTKYYVLFIAFKNAHFIRKNKII